MEKKGLARSRSVLRDPIEVLGDALAVSSDIEDLSTRSRFKLILDFTEDDSVLRLLNAAGLINHSRHDLFKLSCLPEDNELEALKLISGVKFAALQGSLAVLSETDSINEGFYDLFNQHFRSVVGRGGKVSLYANIAVGDLSRRCLVNPHFECIVHVRHSKLPQMPAPFLNRFEKYTLRVQDVLKSRASNQGLLSEIVEAAIGRAKKLLSLFGDKDLFGMVADQTVESCFLDILPKHRNSESPVSGMAPCNSFVQLILSFVSKATSLDISQRKFHRGEGTYIGQVGGR